MERRMWLHHNNPKHSFVKPYTLDRLVYYETYNNIRHAIAREKEVKGWRRAKKNDLVRKLNPKWEDLGMRMFA